MGYAGNKNIEGVYHKIINQIPPHEHYIELFLGSGAIMKIKRPAKMNLGIEIDKITISEGEWKKFPNVKIIRCDVFKFFANWEQIRNWGKEYFIYLDPPYPLSSRRNLNNLYRHEFTDQQHIKLLKILLKLNCNVAISTYANPIYTKLLKDWRKISFKVQTRAGLATELLYMNYPEPTQLHDYRFLGKDISERQMIKRKISRHVERLKRLPALERAAIVSEILKNNSDIIQS